MSDQAKRGRGRPAGTFQAGSVNTRLAALAVGESTVWLTDDKAQIARWQRHITAKRSMRGELDGRTFSTGSGVLVLADMSTEYALKIWRLS